VILINLYQKYFLNWIKYTHIKAALNANCRFVKRSNVTFFCYLGILHPLLSFHNIHSCHFSGTILSAPNTLSGRYLHVLTYFLLLTWGISCDVTINKSIVRLNKPMSLMGFRGLSRKLIVVCAHFRCSRQFD
jgi:hypothetical protein